MTGSSPSPETGPLLDHGRPEDLRQLLDRTPDVLKPILRSAGKTPTALVDAVLAEDGPWLELLVGNREGTAADAALRARLAASGHPLVAAKAFHDGSWALAELRTVLAAADPADRRWFDKPGPAFGLLSVRPVSARHRRLALRAAVVSPFPDVVAHALDTLAHTRELTRAERLRGLLSVLTHGGPAALAGLLDAEAAREGAPEGLEGGEVELGRAAVAVPSGAEALRAAADAAEGPSGLLEEVYGPWEGAAEGLALRGALDWEGLVHSHRSRPLAPEVVAALVGRADCPDGALAALCAGHPGAEELLAGLGRPVPLAAVAALGSAKGARKLLTSAVRDGLGRTVSAAEVLTARPAPAVLESVREVRTTREGRERAAELTGLLAGLVAEKLGDDVAAWRVARARLSRFRGTVPELLDDAAARAARGEGADGPWPEAADRPGFSELVAPKGARAGFAALLDAASVEAQWRLLPHLDGRTAYDLLVLGQWRDEWLERALAAPGREERVLLSRRRDLPAEAVSALAALDDPAVNAGLLYQRAAGWEERLALATGAPFAPGSTGRLPVDEGVREDLYRTTRRDKKPWLAPWIASGDPGMLECALGGVSLKAHHLQWRFALGLWERQGPDGLMDRIPQWFQGKVRRTVAALLDEPDRGAALRRLREVTREAGSAGQLARRLRQWNINRDLEWLLAEGFDWDWDQLLAEHLRSPLPGDQLRELAELDGCPDLLRYGVARMTRSEQSAREKLRQGADASRALAKAPLSPPGEGVSWVEPAIRQGLLTPVELLESAKPARCVLATVAGAGEAEVREAAGEHLAALVRKHLDGSPEAWVLVLRLLPEFTGTVPELLRTAALASMAPADLGAGREAGA